MLRLCACGSRLIYYHYVVPILSLRSQPLPLLLHITCVLGPIAADSPQATNWLHSVLLPLWMGLWPLKGPVLGRPRAVPLATQPITLGCQPGTKQAPPPPNVCIPLKQSEAIRNMAAVLLHCLCASHASEKHGEDKKKKITKM